MPDTREGREKQARDRDRRQRERAIREAIARADEAEPPDDFDEVIDEQPYPTTTEEVIAAVAARRGAEPDDAVPLEERLPRGETFDSPAAVRDAVRRPSVAVAMDRIEAAARDVTDGEGLGARREAYEKTFRALAAVDEDDEDEGIAVLTRWVVDRIRENGRVPRSRAVRHRAANYCRANGYPVRNDDWLGV